MGNVSFEEFKRAMAQEAARKRLGVHITDADARKMLAEDRFVRNYYETWLRHADERESAAVAAEARATSWRGTFPWKTAIVGVLVVGGIIFYNASGLANRKPVYDKVSAYTYCQTAVKEKLKSPSSAKFHDMDATGSGGKWTATGVVEAENAFGVAVLADFQCDIIEGDKIRVDYIRNR